MPSCLKPTGASPPAAAKTAGGQQDERTAALRLRIWEVKAKERMGKIKLLPTTEYSSKQPSDPAAPLVPCTGIFLGPSKSGKTDQPDSGAVKGRLRKDLHLQSFDSDRRRLDSRQEVYRGGPGGEYRTRASLLGRVGRGGAAEHPEAETSKKMEMKKLYQVLVVIDDFADTPQLHKAHGALDTLFIRGRHMQISTCVSSQKLRLISAAVRVNQQFLCCCCWRLRNQHELDAVIED